MPTVSIIINNYNYAPYLAGCIESALEQTVPACEVIVVDDGSTDGSVEQIRAFGDRIVPVIQSNQGQAAAMNAGFARSQGDVVIFLDADDLLGSQAVATVSEAWQDDWSKLQFPLWIIDAAGGRTGRMPPPDCPLPTGDLLPELLRLGTYHWMPTSGNAYARAVLEQIMPMPAEAFRISADLYLSVRSVRFGPVGKLDEPLGSYRIHGANRFNSNRLLAPDAKSLRHRVSSHLARCSLMEEEARREGIALPVNPIIHYTTFYGWVDLTLAWKLEGAGAIAPVAPELLRDGVNDRANRRLGHRVGLCVGLKWAFSILRSLPRWAVRALLQIGRWADPWAIQFIARSLNRRAT